MRAIKQDHALNGQIGDNLADIENQIVEPLYIRRNMIQMGYIKAPDPEIVESTDVAPTLENYYSALNHHDDHVTLSPLNEARIRQELDIEAIGDLSELEHMRDALTHLHNVMSMRYTEYHGEKVIETAQNMEKSNAILTNIRIINNILNSIQKRIRKLK